MTTSDETGDGGVTPTGDDGPLIGLSEFVKKYGSEMDVGLSAVTNWRKRFSDFPRPEGRSRRPQYFVEAELIDWAVRHHKLAPRSRVDDPGLLEVTHRTLQEVGVADDDMTLSLAVAAGELVRRARTGSADLPPVEPVVAEVEALLDGDHAVRLRDGGDPSTTPLVLRSAFADATPRHELIDDPLTGRMIAVAVDVGDTVHDPCCGSGLLLSMLDDADRPDRRFSGVELDPVLATAARRLLAAQGRHAHIVCGSSLESGPVPERYDTVVAVPPKDTPDGSDIPQSEWTARWVTTLVDRLAPGGSAAVVVPTRWLTAAGGRAARTRSDLMDAGMLEAVLLVPTPTGTSRVGTTVVMVIRGSGAAVHRGVLTIDATSISPPRRWIDPSREEQDLVDVVRDVLAAWRGGAGDRGEIPSVPDTRVMVDVVQPDDAREGYFFRVTPDQHGGSSEEPEVQIPIPRSTIADLVDDVFVVTTGREPAVELPGGTRRAVVLETSGPYFGKVTVVEIGDIPPKSRGIAVFAHARPAEVDIPLEFLAAWLASTVNQRHLRILGTGGLRESLSVAHADVLRLSADFPDALERRRIADAWIELDELEADLRRRLSGIAEERSHLAG